MKVHHTLICLFVALQDIMTGGFNEGLPVQTGSEGGNVTVQCAFKIHGDTKFFCRNRCKNKTATLIKTTKNREQKGRYSIEYDRGGFTVNAILKVTITHLKKSDSGWYCCGLERVLLPDGSNEFYLRVIEASTTSKPKVTPLQLTSLPSATTPTTTEQSLTSAVRSSTSSSPSETSSEKSGGSVWLILILILVFMITSLFAAVLLFCRTRKSKPSELPEENFYANVTRLSDQRVYEEVEEGGPTQWPPDKVSTLYAFVTKPETNGSDDYSLAGASSAMIQDKAADKHTDGSLYSTVTFSKNAEASHHDAPSAKEDAVMSSVPRVAADTSTLYSTVNIH